MKKLLLVGGGHAHLYVIKQLQRYTIPNVEVTLISPDCYQYYSGMMSGFIEGLYELYEIRINLKDLAQRSQINWVKDKVMAIHPNERKIVTGKGDLYDYDVISFDIGSLTRGLELPRVSEFATLIKPNYHFPDAITNTEVAEKIVIVGGGAAGIEISLALKARRQKQGIRTEITLISSGELLASENKRISRKIEKIILGKGIKLVKGETVQEVQSRALFTSSNTRVVYDKLIWLTGPKAPGLFKESQLPTDEQGYLLVKDTLQVEKYPSIFGTGDCITLDNHRDLAKTGVYAVRQGPVLFNNILEFVNNSDKREYFRPQRHFIAILSTGNRQGFLIYRGRGYSGRWAWHLKKWIDRRFINKYQN
ncbi:FAD-dependent oxidoreductase [Pseudalkalibacillus sp. A8]|uniref:FAD-dependent oxidoreductase n=1 Tax=Pseudalkalibacillus sp. A8 TaxID=3382641 RepID=UPI0038B4BE26